jgi:NAD+ synthase
MNDTSKKPFSKDIILLDNVEEVVENITAQMRKDTFQRLHRMGGVIGISGGIDSSVCMALAAKAYGPEKMPGCYVTRARF